MNYRADIDGIRCIAVVVVILFHFHFASFSGGFVGVDVFFVLSGYLISSIIFEQLDKGRFSFSQFYFRRIRRLFPVYLVVMLATFGFAYFLMLPGDFREFGQSLLSSTLYASNILFFLEAGYFDTASHLKPLLHTWSLSVEEQFYLVFPLVAWLTARLGRNNRFYFYLLLTLTSLWAAAAYIDRDPVAVFYLYPFRAWEMFLGTLLALRVIPPLQNKGLNNSLALLGLALIIIPVFFYDESTVFPGISALAPCLGTVILIYTGEGAGSVLREILSKRIPVFLGNISYSLYLWHWPILVLYSYITPEGLTGWDILIMGIATFAASVFSWRFIEAPFRYGRVPFSNRRTAVFGATAISSLLLVWLGWQIHVTNGMPERLDKDTAHFAAAASDLFGDLSGCVSFGNARLPDIEYCEIGKPFDSDRYTLIWADSHGGAYKRGYESALDPAQYPALLAWTGGCPPVWGIAKDESVATKTVDERCTQRNRAIKTLLDEDTRIDNVVLVGRWSYYLNAGGVGVDDHNHIQIWSSEGEPGEIKDQREFFVARFLSTVETLNAMGKNVFVVEQVPEFESFVARYLAIGLMNGSADIDQSMAELTVESYQSVQSRQGALQKAMEQAEQNGLITILRTHHFFCQDDQCSLMKNGVPTYFDNNHVSSSGAEKINTMFDPLRQQQ